MCLPHSLPESESPPALLEPFPYDSFFCLFFRILRHFGLSSVGLVLGAVCVVAEHLSTYSFVPVSSTPTVLAVCSHLSDTPFIAPSVTLLLADTPSLPAVVSFQFVPPGAAGSFRAPLETAPRAFAPRVRLSLAHFVVEVTRNVFYLPEA